MSKELTREQRDAALKVCDEVDKARRAALCERDWPCYKHKKTGKVVKAMGTNTNHWNISIQVRAVLKDPNVRHTRTVPVQALNFQRDYELVTV